MRIRVQNFGPLKDAELDLTKPFVVLTGPNGSGKTWLTWLVDVLIESAKSDKGMWERLEKEEGYASFLNFLRYLPNGGRVRTEDAVELAELRMRMLEKRIVKLIPSWFSISSDVVDDVRVELSEPFDRWRWRGEFRFERDKDAEWSARWIPDVEGQDGIVVNVLSGEEIDWRADDNTLKMVAALFWKFCCPVGLGGKELFSAERLAITMLGREVLLLRQAVRPRSWLQVSPAISELLTPPSPEVDNQALYPVPIEMSLQRDAGYKMLAKVNGAFADVADAIEQDLLDGRVDLDQGGQVVFKKSGVIEAINVSASASGVKSLVPLIFYLRHHATQGALLTVDEPEQSLHPNNQRKLARHLASISNLGFQVIISTHSDFIWRELNHLIMLSDPSPSVTACAERMGITEDMKLSPDKVAAYLVKDGTSRPVTVDRMGFEAPTIEDEINRINADSQAIYAAMDAREEP